MSRLIKFPIPLAKAALAASMLLICPVSLVAGDDAVSPEAVKILKQSMSYLAGLQQFGLVTDNSIDVVMVDGQKIQIDNASAVTVQRPNKLHARRLGEFADEEFFYDGKQLSLHFPKAGVYATVDAPDTLEGMLDFARLSLDIYAPAGDFIVADAFDILMDGVTTGFVIPNPKGVFIEGVACDHVAFSKGGVVDFQVWIQRGEKPLPRKLVITSRDMVNAPEYSVVIREWNLEPDVSAGQFTLEAPEDDMNIEFILLDEAGQ